MVKRILLILAFVLIHPLTVLGATISGDFSTNLISHWELEESSGTRLDSTATDNDLTANGTGGIGSATGKIGNGADLESGDSDYLNRNTTIGAYNNNFTYCFWVNHESLPTSGNLMNYVSHQINNGSSDLLTQVDINNSSGTYTLRLFHNFQNIAYTWSVSTGTWYHICAVVRYNTASTGLKLYINGSNVANGTSDVARSMGSAVSEISLGRYWDLGSNALGRYVDGVMDEVTVWNTNLTDSDISTMYNSGSGISYSGGATPSAYINSSKVIIFE